MGKGLLIGHRWPPNSYVTEKSAPSLNDDFLAAWMESPLQSTFTCYTLCHSWDREATCSPEVWERVAGLSSEGTTPSVRDCQQAPS